MLSKTEYFVLGETAMGSLTVAEWEGIHVIYALARREFPGFQFSDVVEVLVKLFDMGYIECRLEEDITRPIYKITKEWILDHFGGDLTEEDINIYPKEAVYSFRATKKGREEYENDIYDAYYPEKS